MRPCDNLDYGICQPNVTHCGVEFKYASGIRSATVGTFFNDLEYISCHNATSLFSHQAQLLPDHIDLVHVILAVAILISLTVNIAIMVLIQKRPRVKVTMLKLKYLTY